MTQEEINEVLIEQVEQMEREYDSLKLAKMREGARLRKEIRELRHQLRIAMGEVAELQSLLEKAWVRT